MRAILRPVSWLYGLGAAARNGAFDAGLLRRRSVGVPVIAVGNMTAGGTGKTPLVEEITRRLAARGMHVAVVSRGYGRRSQGVVVVSERGDLRVDALEGGDEPVQIARKFRSASVVVGERRVDAAAVAVKQCGADVIVLDDAFQHRAIVRDLDLVVLDSGTDLFHEGLLPAGMRREWLSGIRRAGLIAFSRATGSGEPAWAGGLERWCRAPSFAFRTVIASCATIPADRAVEVKSLAGKTVMAFSGIGNHRGFVDSLRRAGVTVAVERSYRDHHWYAERDLEDILRAAEGTDACVTTEKDMVRLVTIPRLAAQAEGPAKLLYAAAAVEFLRGAEALEAALDCAIGRGTAS